MKYFSLFFLFSFAAHTAELVDFGKYTADKIPTTIRIEMQSARIAEIRIVGTHSRTQVLRALLYTQYGTYGLRALEREVRSNESARAILDPRDFVYTLELEVQSELIGSRGEFRVQALIENRLPPPPPPRPPQYDAREAYNQIVFFANDPRGLNVPRVEAERMAREWTRRGSYCGTNWAIDSMTRDFYNRADMYRRQRYRDYEARQNALSDIRYQSPCTDIFYVN